MNTFFYGALPYIAFTIFLVGTIARFAFFERGWTTKSSEFLEKKQVRFAVPIFHLGLVMALGGHLIGILVPKFVTEGAGVNEEMYHMIALSGGIPAGALFVLGLVLCIVRRFSSDRLVVNTSAWTRCSIRCSRSRSSRAAGARSRTSPAASTTAKASLLGSAAS